MRRTAVLARVRKTVCMNIIKPSRTT